MTFVHFDEKMEISADEHVITQAPQGRCDYISKNQVRIQCDYIIKDLQLTPQQKQSICGSTGLTGKFQSAYCPAACVYSDKRLCDTDDGREAMRNCGNYGECECYAPSSGGAICEGNLRLSSESCQAVYLIFHDLFSMFFQELMSPI